MSVLVGILFVSSLSALTLVLRWQEFSSFIRRNWRLLVLAEVIFLAAFLAFVALRAANPDLWHFAKGGGKAHGLCVPECCPPFHIYAALRSVVCRRVFELLLFWSVYRSDLDTRHRDSFRPLHIIWRRLFCSP